VAMSETITMRSSDVRTKFSEALDAVMLGNTVVITRHGRQIAVLAPPQQVLPDAPGRKSDE
jgi:prevent-host-death family protein